MLYKQILSFLRLILPGMRKSHLETLSWIIAGILRGSNWPHKKTMASLARAISRQASFEAKKKQLLSFLSNPAFNLSTFNRTGDIVKTGRRKWFRLKIEKVSWQS